MAKKNNSEKKQRNRKKFEKIVKGLKKDFDKAKKENIAAGGTGTFADVAIKSLNRASEELDNTVTLEDFKEFRKKWGLSDKELLNVVSNNPTTDREQKAYADYLSKFSDKQFGRLDAKSKKDPNAKFYNKATGFRDTSTLQTEKQQEATSLLAQDLLGQPAFQEVQQGAAGQTQPTVLRSARDVIGEQAGRLGEILGPRIKETFSDQEKAEIAAAETPEEVDAIKQKYERRKEVASALGQAGGQLAGIGAEAYRRGVPPVERFGTPGQSELLNQYDALINMVRPDRTRSQAALAALSPYGTQAGSTLGSAIGTIAGGPLGSAIGGTAGSLLGLGAGELARRYGQPDSEFSKIGRFLSGSQPGIFRSGERGLAGIIAGEDPRSGLRTGFGLFRKKAPEGKIGRLRGILGQGIRGLGKFIGSTGRAQQLRNILEIGQVLYGLGKQLGIVKPKKESIVGNLMSDYREPTGYDIASAALPGALQFAVPELQKLASRSQGRPVLAQQAVGNLDQELLASITPQIASQNIRASELAGKRKALGLKIAGVKVDKETQRALNELKKQQQQKKFQRATKRQDLTSREAVARSKIQAQRNKLAALEALAGQQTVIQPQLERVPQRPGIAEGLGIAAQELQRATTPFVQQSITEALRKPINVQSVKGIGKKI